MTDRRTSLGLVLLVASMGSSVLADDWPQWRGPRRDGLWCETGIIDKFDGGTLPVRWRVGVSNGYSGPTVASGRVYLTDRLTAPEPVEQVHCYDAMNGRAMWSYAYACDYRGIAQGNGPRAAVTSDEGRAYALGAVGHFHCFDAISGNVLWAKDLREEYDIRMPEWGIAAAPLVEGRLVIVLIGGRDACLVAFDKVSGAELWRALSDRAGYSSPLVIDQANRRVLVAWTGERIVGLDPATGKLLWEHPFPPAQMIHNIASPVFYDGHLFVSGFFDGSLLLKVDPDRLAVEELWRRRGPSERKTEGLHCCISTPILANDHIYGVDSYGQLRGLDLHTGDRIWESLNAVPTARWATIHMVQNGQRVWMFTERGELVISRLSPRGYDEVSRAKLIEPTEGQLNQRGGVCWAPPAFAYKHVYVRNDNELVCANLSAGN